MTEARTEARTRPWLTLQSLAFLALVLATSALTLQRTRLGSAALPDEWLRGGATRALEAQYDQAFAGRQLGVNLWAALEYTLFREGRPGVIVGRHGWLYSDEEFRVHADSEAQLARNLARISWLRGELAKHNVRLLVAVLPAKARVYPEHLGTRAPAKLQQDLHGRIHEHLQAEGINAPDLLAALEEAKREQPVFLRRDTHWTPAGAQRVAQQLAAAALAAVRLETPPQRFRTTDLGPQTLRGDLLNFLPFDPWFAKLRPKPETLPRLQTEALDAARSSGLLDESAAPAIALVGTSYSADARWNFVGALRQALAADVANYAREGVGPFRPLLDYLASADFRAARPRLLIWELPERYLLQAQALDDAALPPALRDPPSTPRPSEETHS